jgi:transcriptional regulator with XRE-family HTH domain
MAAPLASGDLERTWPFTNTQVGGAFGTLLRDHRSSARLTQEELAELSGMSVRAIRNLEIGRTERPQQHTVHQLAGALGLTDSAHGALLVAAGRAHLALAGIDQRGTPAPCELPADTQRLVGRSEVLARLTEFLGSTGTAEPKLAIVTGAPGTGKTATVVHIAHQLRSNYPDGQIYADLEAPDGSPVPASALLGRLLRSLGMSSVPDNVDERGGLLRTIVAARRVLLVLDNAAGEAQIRPLLTLSPRSAVLVASRQRLTALRCGRTVVLAPLGEVDALVLLAELVGTRRVLAEPQAAKWLAEYCARRPLALHIAGAWLAPRPRRTLAELARLLQDERRRLDHLDVADLSVRSSVAASLRRLDEREQRTVAVLVATGRAEFDADELHRIDQDSVEKLFQANILLAENGRYQVDPLVRLVVRENELKGT